MGERKRANDVRPYRCLWGYQGLCDKFVVVMFHTVVPNVVWITQGGMGKRERDVEGAVPYMVCENINNVRIT